MINSNLIECIFDFIEGNKRDSKTAVARLLLVVQEAHGLIPSTVTLDRHR